MLIFNFTKKAENELRSLDKKMQDSIVRALSTMKDPIIFAAHRKMLIDQAPATHRIRIGDYRLLCDIHGQNIDILKIAHRKDAYR